MAISVVSDLDTAVAQLIAHITDVMTGKKPDRGVGMPQVVNPYLPQSRFF